MNHPDQVCQYLMQLTHELIQLPVRFFGGNLNDEPMDRLRLEFKRPEPEKTKEPSEEWKDEASKAVTVMRLGCGIQVKTIKRSEVVW